MKKIIFISTLCFFAAPLLGQDKIDLLVRSEKILAQGDTTKALAAFQEILRIYPQDFTSALRLAEINFSKKDYYQALQYCNVALDITDNFIGRQEVTYNKLGINPDSTEFMRQYKADQAHLHHLKGLIRVAQERPLDAEHEYNRALILNNTAVEVYVDLARLQAKQGRFIAAKKSLKLAKEKDQNIGSVLQLAALHYQIREIDSAKYYYETLKKESPTSKWPYYYLGLMYSEQQNFEQSIKEFSEYLKIDSVSEEVYYRRAVNYVELANWENAHDDWSKVTTLNSNNAEAWRNKGLTNFQLMHYDKAVDDFTSALKVDPKQPYTQINRGYCLYLQRKNKAALEDIQQGLTIVPNYGLGYYFEALTYKSLRKKKKACASLNKAVQFGVKDEEIEPELLRMCY